MCPPEFFDIKYSINPWMNMHNHAEKQYSTTQWNTLRKIFEDLGEEVFLMKPEKFFPDLVFIDSGVCYKNIFIPSNFTHPERQGERKIFCDYYKTLGFEIREIPEESGKFTFEGHGDTLWAGKNLWCGYGFRSTKETHQKIFEILKEEDFDGEVISLELRDKRFYHLDTCFCPLSENLALCFLEGFSQESQKILKEKFQIIPVSEEEACKFACNAVVIGKNVVLPEGSSATEKNLQNHGFIPHPVNVSEFMKSGGACKCLSFPFEK